MESVQVSAPTARGASTITRVRLRNLKTRLKTDRSFRGSETFPVPDFERRPCQLLYEQHGTYHFMDQESYEQFQLPKEALQWESNFLHDGLEGLIAWHSAGEILGLELPPNVVLEVTDTPPAIKGASQSARTKPATLSTGYVVQVPEHVTNGDRLKIDTTEGGFLGRA